MAKHGGEQHYLSPYNTYVTSARQPFVGAGFNPVADTQAIAARFVSPTGLAGPMGYVAAQYPTRLGAPAFANLRARWSAFKARVKVNMQANRFVQDMRLTQVAPGVMSMDTSPRPFNSDPTALAVQSGWAPAPQSRASASGYMPAQGDPPNNGAVPTAINLAPSEAGKPIQLWQRVMQSGLPPVVAQRAQNDVLARWFAAKAGS
jgi:hypothetical protein